MSGSNQPLRFDDLAPIEESVSIGGRDYILREASTDAARKYRNQMTRCAKMNDGKVSGIGDIADLQPLLVHLCLFTSPVNGNGTPKNVPLEIIYAWPERVTKALYARCKEISPDLEEKGPTSAKTNGDGKEVSENNGDGGRDEGGSAKNSPGATMATST